MLDITYFELRSNIRSKPESPEVLKEMKAVFREDIKSIRTEDRIRTVSELIEVLEKRDVINKYNIDPLTRIASILNNHFPCPLYSASSSMNLPQKIPLSNNHYGRISRNVCDPVVKAKVYKAIASEIGRNWTTFARYLSMPESRIDDLHHKMNKDRVYEILYFYEEECDTRKWRSVLLQALIECRRKDLYEKVQFIFDTYNS